MKKIEAIIRPGKVGEVRAALEKAGHPGLMISEIEGHGNQKGIEQHVRGRKYKVDMLPKARVEVVVRDKEAGRIIKAIRDAVVTGEIGDGKIFVSSMEDAVRIRTGETGEDAI
jgi:nitrogen regulatory protein P-II 1